MGRDGKVGFIKQSLRGQEAEGEKLHGEEGEVNRVP